MAAHGLGEMEKKSKFIESGKGQEIMENHNRQRPEGT